MDGHEFSGWRAYLWPIHRHELKKLLPMLILFFLVAFNYNLLRLAKDALVVTAKDAGAEVIPFLKVWMMFPMALAMTSLFAWLSHHYSRERVFYIMLGIFLSYFFAFSFILYPLRDYLHPHGFADRLEAFLPRGFRGMVAMLRYWTFTSYYAMAESWSAVILSVLFWGTANEITRVGEAKRYYGIFGIGLNASGFFAGQVMIFLTQNQYNPSLPFGRTGWEQSITLVTLMVLVVGLLSMAIYRWLCVYVLTDKRYYDPEHSVANCRTKVTVPTMIESFRYIAKNRYLSYIAVIVIAYNAVINLVEVVWKYEVHALYPDPAAYNAYMAQVMTVISILATVTAVIVTGNAIRRMGWTWTAMLTPGILFVTSVLFFSFMLFDSHLVGVGSLLGGISPLAVAVFFGSSQNALSRAAKYTVYDSTKEMAFIPLDSESKLMGKAAIDGVGSRLGKSTGAFIHQVLLLLCGTLAVSLPYVGILLLVIIACWMVATLKLGRAFDRLSLVEEEQEILSAAEEQPLPAVELASKA